MTGEIALIDYGAGNLRSVHNALQAVGASDVAITADPDTVSAADRIILPGVGAFAACMQALASLPDMIETLNECVRGKARPFLGICVGMQLMAERGEEHGSTEGLGWIGGSVKPMTTDLPELKIPHMGWNDVRRTDSPSLVEDGEAYFLHGYAMEVSDPANIVATTDHGHDVVAAIGRDTMLGVQFHPEKSQRYGLAMLERFLSWRP